MSDLTKPVVFQELSKNFIVSKNNKVKNPFPFEKDALEVNTNTSDKENFKLINLEFLQMKNNDGLPKFSLFNINQKNCELSLIYRIQGDLFKFEFVNNFITGAYKDSYKVLNYHYMNAFIYMKNYMKENIFKLIDFSKISSDIKCCISLTSTFEGIIPEKTRKLILKHRTEFDDIFIIAESNNWKLEEQETTYVLNKDPLVVGLFNNKFYLIDVFDLTFKEDYAIKEFTS